MNIKRVKWNNVSVALLGLAVTVIAISAAETLEALSDNTHGFMEATLTPESSGALALGMILVTVIAALKLLTQRNR